LLWADEDDEETIWANVGIPESIQANILASRGEEEDLEEDSEERRILEDS